MKKIGVLTSGGDAPGMNAAVRAVTRGAIYNGMEVYGIARGYEGLIYGEIRPLSISSVGDIIHRGGTMLKTDRSPDFMTPAGFQRALNMLESFGLEAVVTIGGDGTMRGALELTKAGVTTVGLPGTIDNDLAYTDFTIGFDTAVNTVLSAISNIRDTSSSHGRSTVIEVMGRDCGDIALYAGLCGGADVILIPEEEVDINAVCRKVMEGKNRGKTSNIIVVAEGVDADSQELAKDVTERTGLETRAVVLGYIQRGGSPTAKDRMLASRMGYRAVELLMPGGGGRAVGVRGEEIIDMDLAEALAMKRRYDRSIIELADVLSR
ncbi:MAG: 6-phosphofructokinase [Bacillota bacterium]|nr:6-phosphofructokinase [Bacillota bacterium]